MKYAVRSRIKNMFSGVFVIVISSFISALGLHIFVYPSNFAPSGVDGIATLLQKITGINAGFFNFFINLPLLVAAWFILNKRYVIYTVAYTTLTSALLLLMANIELYQYISDGDMILPAIFGGIFQGLTSLMLRIGGSAGGIDVAACMIQKKLPHQNVEKIISSLSYIVVAISYFVYLDVNSILLSIIEIFVCEKVSTSVLRSNRNAVEFKIVTDHPKEVCDMILYKLNKTATVLDGNGVFSENKKAVILCVISYRQLPQFLNIINSYPDSFDWR